MTAKILIHGNHIPKLKTGIAVGIKRRLHLIEYRQPITTPDTTFKERLKLEYPAILHSFIQGCLDWQQSGGLGKPEVIAENVTAYLADEDSINAWAGDCLEQHKEYRVQSSAAYKSFKAWAALNNEYCPSNREFSKRLQDRGWESRHTASGTQFMGWRIRENDDIPAYHNDY